MHKKIFVENLSVRNVARRFGDYRHAAATPCERVKREICRENAAAFSVITAGTKKISDMITEISLLSAIISPSFARKVLCVSLFY